MLHLRDSLGLPGEITFQLGSGKNDLQLRFWLILHNGRKFPFVHGSGWFGGAVSGAGAGGVEAYSQIREDTCIITHGGVIAAIMEHLFPQEHKTRYAWQTKNGHGYMLQDNKTWRALEEGIEKSREKPLVIAHEKSEKKL